MIDIKRWVLANKVGVSILAGVAALFIVLAGLNGCVITDLVKVKVPRYIQKAMDVPPKVTLTDAPELLRAYKNAGTKFQDNIVNGMEWLGFLASLTTTSLEFGKHVIPGGAIGLSLLSLAAGIVIKGPGTAREKNKSYNKGLETGRRMINIYEAITKDKD